MPCTQNLDCPCFIIKFRIYFTSLFFSFLFNKEDWMTCNKSLALLSAALHFICSTDSRSLYFNTALWNGTGYVWFQGWARIIFLKLFLMNHRQIDRGIAAAVTNYFLMIWFCYFSQFLLMAFKHVYKQVAALHRCTNLHPYVVIY